MFNYLQEKLYAESSRIQVEQYGHKTDPAYIKKNQRATTMSINDFFQFFFTWKNWFDTFSKKMEFSSL